MKPRRCKNVRKRITKRCAKKSFRENIRECMCRTDKPRKQCVAIAYSVLRASCRRAGKRAPK